MTSFWKPAKGTALMERRQRRKDTKAAEDHEKDLVRARDKRCRWPHCANCKQWQPRLEVAHLTAKGMGGDPAMVRTSADRMILLDWLTHQAGTSSLEQHGKWIVPLTDRGTDGPCEFWQDDEQGRPFLVARERAPFLYERD